MKSTKINNLEDRIANLEIHLKDCSSFGKSGDHENYSHLQLNKSLRNDARKLSMAKIRLSRGERIQRKDGTLKILLYYLK